MAGKKAGLTTRVYSVQELDPLAILVLELAGEQPVVCVDELDRITILTGANSIKAGTFALQGETLTRGIEVTLVMPNVRHHRSDESTDVTADRRIKADRHDRRPGLTVGRHSLTLADQPHSAQGAAGHRASRVRYGSIWHLAVVFNSPLANQLIKPLVLGLWFGKHEMLRRITTT